MLIPKNTAIPHPGYGGIILMEKNSWLLGFDCQQESQLILKATKDFLVWTFLSEGAQWNNWSIPYFKMKLFKYW